jgi:hypothetical protein
MIEHKEICEKILNPFKDVLGLFKSKDSNIKEFALCHQLVPECGRFNEIYINCEGHDVFHVQMHFIGTNICFSQEGVTTIRNNFHDVESFTVVAKDVMERFKLETPEDIYPYINEHYNTPDSFYRIKKEFEV